MTAKRKAKISLIVGGVVGSIIFISIVFMLGQAKIQGTELTQEQMIVWISEGIIMIPTCMMYAFGYAFGWKRCKGFVASMAKVSADIAFVSIIIQLITGKGIGKGLIIAMFVFCTAVGIVWLPGIAFGIKELKLESC